MLRLRPYKRCDAKWIAGWIKDEVAFRKWCADRYDAYPITGEDINANYDKFSDNDYFYEMTAFDETGVVGHLIMRFTDDEKRCLRLGFIIIDDAKRGKGYGREMVGLSLKYAFEILKAEKVTLGVFENNLPAYKCYQAAGFIEQDMKVIEYYHVLNEEWKCIELGITAEAYHKKYQ